MHILTELCASATGTFVFPGNKAGRPLSSMAMAMQVRRMGRSAYSVHGFRSSFKTWAVEESDFPNELSEAALAHVTGDAVERAYRRTDALERQRALMDAWSTFLA